MLGNFNERNIVKYTHFQMALINVKAIFTIMLLIRQP